MLQLIKGFNREIEILVFHLDVSPFEMVIKLYVYIKLGIYI